MSEEVIANAQGAPQNYGSTIDVTPQGPVNVDPHFDNLFKTENINTLMAATTDPGDRQNLMMKYEEWKGAMAQSPETAWHISADKIIEELSSETTVESKEDEENTQPAEDGENTSIDLTPEELTQFADLFEANQAENKRLGDELAKANQIIKKYNQDLGDLASNKFEIDRLTQENNILKNKYNEMLEEKAKVGLDQQELAHKAILPISDEKKTLFKKLNQDINALDDSGKAEILANLSNLWESITGKDLSLQIRSFAEGLRKIPESHDDIGIPSAYSHVLKEETKTADAIMERAYM